MEEIQSLIDQINRSTDFQINKKVLKEKSLTELHVAYNNGLFLITPALIAFVAVWPDEHLYLEDVYENPIQINRTEFFELIKQHYYATMNQWCIQFNELKSVKKI